MKLITPFLLIILAFIFFMLLFSSGTPEVKKLPSDYKIIKDLATSTPLLK